MSYPGVSPKVDIVFKKLFGVEENKDLLLSLINATLSKEDQINDLDILNPYQFPNLYQDKVSILDIKARSKRGELFNIEIQLNDDASYNKRALYYWGKLYTDQLQKGDDYDQLHKAIGIHILNFTSILESKKYHNVFHIREKDEGFIYFKDLELHTIELNKFATSEDDLSHLLRKVHNSLDRWILFLARNDLLNPEKLPKEIQEKEIEKAFQVLEQMQLNFHEKDAYEARMKWIRMKNGAVKRMQKSHQEGIEEGMKKGIEEGMKKGIEEGMKEGMKKGIEEGMKEGIQAVALRMLKHGSSLKDIASFTGLSLEEIQSLSDV